MKSNNWQSRLTLVFATIDRPHCVQRLIDSARKQFPDIQIIVGNQGKPSCQLEDYYQKNGIKVAYIPSDAGVSAARNAAVALVETEYVLLADDDFIIGHDTSLSAPLAILDSDHEIDIVGGMLYDIYGPLDFSAGYERHWERIFFLDEKKGLLTSLPIDSFFPLERRVKGYTYFRCDAVMNWAVMRKSIFTRGAKWDEQYTCNGEHEDFYLNIKKNTTLGVAYSNDFYAYHHHPVDYVYSSKRDRQLGWQQFAEKWGIQQYYNPPWGLQVFSRDLYDQAPPLSFDDFLSRSKEHRPKRDFVGVNFNENGEAFIPASTKAGKGVYMFVSKDGHVQASSPVNTNIIPEQSITAFTPKFLNDVRDLTIHVSDEHKITSSELGSPITIYFNIRNRGPRIGVLHTQHKIMAGLKLRNATGKIIEGQSNWLTPLINDIAENSLQYVSFIVELPSGEYTADVDLWLDYLGWMRIEDTIQLIIK